MSDEKTLDQNKQIARRYYEECWNQGKADRLSQLVSRDCRIHDPVFPNLVSGLDRLTDHLGMCRKAFPDLQFTIDDTIAERDEVVVHWTARGTQGGPFLGIPPTHKAASVSGTSIFRIQNQKISEQFIDWNLLTLLEQLGAATAPKVQVMTR